MKLYPKKLNNLEELKLEKQRLRDELRAIEEKGFISKDDFLGSGSGDSNFLGDATELFKEGSVKEAAIALGLPLLKLAGKNLEAATLKKVAKELVGGYAKWKAAQLAYKGVLRVIAHYKSKAAEAKK